MAKEANEKIKLNLRLKRCVNKPVIEEVEDGSGNKESVYRIVTAFGFEGKEVDMQFYERFAELIASGEMLKVTIEPVQKELI